MESRWIIILGQKNAPAMMQEHFSFVNMTTGACSQHIVRIYM